MGPRWSSRSAYTADSRYIAGKPHQQCEVASASQRIPLAFSGFALARAARTSWSVGERLFHRA